MLAREIGVCALAVAVVAMGEVQRSTHIDVFDALDNRDWNTRKHSAIRNHKCWAVLESHRATLFHLPSSKFESVRGPHKAARDVELQSVGTKLM